MTLFQNQTSLGNQTLLIDADDTLWENSVYFERAIASFISFLDHQTHTAAQVREHLDRIEQQTIAAHGYGTGSFGRSLVRCFEELSGASATADEVERLLTFAAAIAGQQIELLPGVAATLAALASAHTLILMTKGDPLEQCDKLARSGLDRLFTAVEVVREKHVAAYREVLARHRLDPALTWMIGNSPRSDINPALAAGLNAVFLKHPATWSAEEEPLGEPAAERQLLSPESFAALRTVFSTG